MSSWHTLYLRLMQRLLPSPLALALLLTLLSFVLARLLPAQAPALHELSSYWYKGVWELLAFSMQMVLILVLGHTLALSPGAQWLIQKLAAKPKDTASAAALVCLIAVIAGYINWGMCVIVGALLARQIAVRQQALGNKSFNYPLIAAAGYAGMMIWHGGLSGSAPLVVAQEAHFLSERIGQIPVSETLLAVPNLLTSALMLLCLPALMYFLGKLWPGEPDSMQLQEDIQASETQQLPNYLSLDKSPLSGILSGSLLILYAGYQAIENASEQGLSFLDLNYINFLLLGFSLLLHGSLDRFSEAVQAAVGGASGIIIQFPLYAGIMGLIKYGGLVELFSDFFLQISDARSLPVFTFLSAGLVNFFVPSGGGQWAVQGPIMLQAAQSLQVAPEKVIMALAYGDGLTNMLQPFWALPLLGITRLQARDILPYTALLLLTGLLIYSAVLWFVW